VAEKLKEEVAGGAVSSRSLRKSGDEEGETRSPEDERRGSSERTAMNLHAAKLGEAGRSSGGGSPGGEALVAKLWWRTETARAQEG
jgi:hypothetical protein